MYSSLLPFLVTSIFRDCEKLGPAATLPCPEAEPEGMNDSLTLDRATVAVSLSKLAVTRIGLSVLEFLKKRSQVVCPSGCPRRVGIPRAVLRADSAL
jgi:hypothetical protein